MKKFLLALLTAATAAALLCGAAAVSTYSVGYDAPAGISTIVVQDSSAAVVLQAADIDHIHADYTYTSSYAFESSKLFHIDFFLCSLFHLIHLYFPTAIRYCIFLFSLRSILYASLSGTSSFSPS